MSETSKAGETDLGLHVLCVAGREIVFDPGRFLQ